MHETIPRPEKRRIRRLRAALAAVLAVTLLGGSAVCLADGLGGALGGTFAGAGAQEADEPAESRDTIEGAGYAAPEEAIIAYAEYLKAGDLDGMISTFAIESYVDAFDLEAYLGYLKNFNTNMISGGVPLFGSGDSLRRSLSIESRKARVVSSIAQQYIVRIDPSGFFSENQMTYMPLQTEEEAAAFAAALGGGPDFSGMEIGAVLTEGSVPFDLPSDALSSARQHAEQYIPIYGVEDIADLCLSLTIDGAEYVLFTRTGLYGGRWYNILLSNDIATILAIPSEFMGLVRIGE